MKNRHRIVWSKGMYLNPQHFQIQDQFHIDAAHFRFAASLFANWGVTGLEIDSEAVQNGLIRIIRCSGIMPDGEPFDMPDTDAIPDSRPLAEYFPPSRSSVDVYLAIPENRPRARNVTVATESEESDNGQVGPPATRYLAETVMFSDENLGDEEKPVQVARRAFRILFEGEYRGGFSAFRIAQVTRNPAGTPILNPRFAAPCLDLASSEYLGMLLRREIEILATKNATLSGARRQGGISTAEFLPSETMSFWLLHTVNSYLPELKHIWKVRHGHPEVAYVAMLRLAGALATFSLESDPQELPDYDHNDLGRCFTLLDNHIRQLIGTVLPDKFVPIKLELQDRFIWGGTVTEDHYFKNSQFFLAVNAKMGIDDLIRKVPQLMKVSGPGEIQHLIRNSLPGVTLRHTPVPPSAIRVKLDYQYFNFNQAGPLWEDIVLSRQVSVYVPGEIVDPKMEVIIVLQ
jgi:type VI secretion system protein ImpJ